MAQKASSISTVQVQVERMDFVYLQHNPQPGNNTAVTQPCYTMTYGCTIRGWQAVKIILSLIEISKSLPMPSLLYGARQPRVMMYKRRWFSDVSTRQQTAPITMSL
jgi:hypothetical protein